MISCWTVPVLFLLGLYNPLCGFVRIVGFCPWCVCVCALRRWSTVIALLWSKCRSDGLSSLSSLKSSTRMYSPRVMFSVGMGSVRPQPWMRRRCSIFALWDVDHVCDSAVLSWNVGNHKPPWEVLSLVSDLQRIKSNSELTAQHAWNCSTDVP